jgi:hypothetical protein
MKSIRLAAGLVFAQVATCDPFRREMCQLDRTRRHGAAEYGKLASRYVFAFEEKWTHGVRRDAADLPGSSDVQGLQNLANSYAAATDMRLVPFRRDDVVLF